MLPLLRGPWYRGIMDATKLATLKKRLLEAKDLTQIAEYFFDEFANDPKFALSGKPYTNERLVQALGQVVLKLTGQKAALMTGKCRRVEKHRLVHGYFDFGEWTLLMFYMEEVEQGFVALGDQSGPSIFGRFSLIEPAGGKPIVLH